MSYDTAITEVFLSIFQNGVNRINSFYIKSEQPLKLWGLKISSLKWSQAYQNQFEFKRESQ